MKTQQITAATLILVASGLLSPHAHAAAGGNSSSTTSTIPSAPSGVMSAYPTVVQTGTKPTLTWNILYPSSLTGTNPPITVNPPGTLIANSTVYATVQIVGTGITACDSSQDSLPHSVDARVSLNHGAYSQLFYGTQADVVPSKQLYIKKMTVNQTLDFGGRYVKNGIWSPFYTSWSSNFQVVSLVNGSTIPTTFSLYQSPTVACYLKPYLSSTGKVNIGPLSVLVLMELGQTNRNLVCSDLQDLVLLVTFSTSHPNNGHGNNLDGVDSSNPGQGHGGPNGAVDPSAGVDDEIR